MLEAVNHTRGTILCARLEAANGIGGRARGLLGRDHLDADQGLLFLRGRLEPFMWMHMFFMRFPIDIVFLGHDGLVVRISHQLRPWRVSPIVFTAHKALELAAGAALRSATTIGDKITMVEPPAAPFR